MWWPVALLVLLSLMVLSGSEWFRDRAPGLSSRRPAIRWLTACVIGAATLVAALGAGGALDDPAQLFSNILPSANAGKIHVFGFDWDPTALATAVLAVATIALVLVTFDLTRRGWIEQRKIAERTWKEQRDLAEKSAEQQRDLAEKSAKQQLELAEKSAEQQRDLAEKSAKQQLVLAQSGWRREQITSLIARLHSGVEESSDPSAISSGPFKQRRD